MNRISVSGNIQLRICRETRFPIIDVSAEKGDQTLQLFTAGQSTTSSKSSKNSILKKKLQAEKLALELKIAEEKCKEEIQLQ